MYRFADLKVAVELSTFPVGSRPKGRTSAQATRCCVMIHEARTRTKRTIASIPRDFEETLEFFSIHISSSAFLGYYNESAHTGILLVHMGVFCSTSQLVLLPPRVGS